MARGRRARHRGATAAPFSPKGAVQVALDEIATLLVMLDGDGLARRFSQRVGKPISCTLTRQSGEQIRYIFLFDVKSSLILSRRFVH